MALVGNGFLVMWHDITPDMQAEYTEWHTREHMPERLSIPGFLVGKRLVNHDLDRYRFGTIYTGRDVEVFRSPAYLARLNDPTPWSNRLQPAFRNFLRVACERVASAGRGDGGAVATTRLSFSERGGEAAVRDGAAALVEAILGIGGVCAAHVGLARTEVSGVRTRETELRPEMAERGFDAVVITEGSGRPELEAVIGEIEAAVAASSCGLTEPRSIAYNLAYELTATDMGQS
ncbi:MAG: hypothetical protein ACK4U0_00170 [Mesorhizobium sp.]